MVLTAVKALLIPLAKLDIPAVAANATDTYYQSSPLARGTTGMFYSAPGVAGGGGFGFDAVVAQAHKRARIQVVSCFDESIDVGGTDAAVSQGNDFVNIFSFSIIRKS